MKGHTDTSFQSAHPSFTVYKVHSAAEVEKAIATAYQEFLMTAGSMGCPISDSAARKLRYFFNNNALLDIRLSEVWLSALCHLINIRAIQIVRDGDSKHCN